MTYAELLHRTTIVRVTYLVAIVEAAVNEANEVYNKETAVDNVLSCFSLTVNERSILRAEILNRCKR